jgi:hypothetical protein
MRRNALGVFLTVGVLTTALLGCPLKRKSDDAPLDAGTISVTGTGAKNEAQITRYPNETSLGGAPALIANNGTVARTFPGAGAQVAVGACTQHTLSVGRLPVRAVKSSGSDLNGA